MKDSKNYHFADNVADWYNSGDACKASVDTNCWTGDFNTYHATGTTYTACDATTCLKGCINSEKCQLPCSDNQFCHLCADRECTQCDNYTQCKADNPCGDKATYKASDNNCECTAPNTRTDIKYVCADCHANC
jgi:hypothetical protein